MIGYWVPSVPVAIDHPDVLATTYVADGKTMVSIASWAESPVEVQLDIDWDVLGLDPDRATISAPAIENFQASKTFSLSEPIPVEPGQGWLLIISDQ